MMRNKLSKILSGKNDQKINEIKTSLESFLAQVAGEERELFSSEEVENMLLDIYNLTR